MLKLILRKKELTNSELKEEIRASINKAVRKERTKKNTNKILKKYFDKINLDSLSGNEKLMSVFGDHHRKLQESIISDRYENKKAMHKIAQPVEGIDFLYEDSKAETQNYQDIYNDILLKEVDIIR